MCGKWCKRKMSRARLPMRASQGTRETEVEVVIGSRRGSCKQNRPSSVDLLGRDSNPTRRFIPVIDKPGSRSAIKTPQRRAVTAGASTKDRTYWLSAESPADVQRIRQARRRRASPHRPFPHTHAGIRSAPSGTRLSAAAEPTPSARPHSPARRPGRRAPGTSCVRQKATD